MFPGLKILILIFILLVFTLCLHSTGIYDTMIDKIDLGNKLFYKGDYPNASKTYDEAIKLAYVPIVSSIIKEDPCSWGDSVDMNNATLLSSNESDPNYCEGVALLFDVTNPNKMDMRIESIYADIYISPPCIGEIRIGDKVYISPCAARCIRTYFCSIDPSIRSQKCFKKSYDYDYIGLKQGELERFCVVITPNLLDYSDNEEDHGLNEKIYEFINITLSMQYAIEREINNVTVGEITCIRDGNNIY